MLLSEMSMEELTSYIKLNGKKANQQIDRLQKAGYSSNAYNHVKRLQEAGSIATRQGKHGARFSTSTRNITRNQALKKAKAIQGYLASKTGTVAGVKKATAKAYKSYKKSHPNTQMTQQEFSEFWQSGVVEEFKKLYKSEETATLSNEVGELSIADIERILKEGGFAPASAVRDGERKRVGGKLPPLSKLYKQIEKEKKAKSKRTK